MAIRFNARNNSIITDASAIDFEQPISVPASTTSLAGLNIAEGVAPTAPVDGDIWVTTTDIFARIDGVSESLLGGGGGGSVTSVAAGDGLDFTTITGSGSVILGTPGSASASSTNAVTATSHTHAIDSTIARVNNETFTGTFEHSNASFGVFTIDRVSTTGGAAIAYQNDDGLKGYAGFNDSAEFEVYTAAAGSSGFTVDSSGNVTATNFTGSSSGTNTGDQTSIVGITGTTAQFNTALSDGSFATGGGTATGTNTGDQTITLTGNVTGTGTGSFTTTIANDAVTNARLANMAANTVKANATAGAADPADLAVGTNTVVGRVGGNIVAAQVATGQIANDAVTNTKIANMAQSTIKGRAVSAGTGDPTDLTATQATAILNVFTSTLNGLAPSSGGGTTNFLRADGPLVPGGLSNPLTADLDFDGFNLADGGVIFLREQAAADADVSNQGQVWVRTADNNLHYTTDAGVDVNLSGDRYYIGTAQESATSTITLANITGLSGIPLRGGTYYHIRFVCFAASNTAGTNPGLRLRLDYTGSTGSGDGRVIQYRDSGLVTSSRGLVDITVIGLECGGNTDEAKTIWEAHVETVTAGNLNVQFSQNTSNASASVISEGAFLEIWEAEN